MRLSDKVALVTGAGSGMGAAIAQGYLKEGAKVVFADINKESAEKIALESGVSDEMWLAAYINVGKLDDVKRCIEETIQRFGKLDILVANAGITIRKPFLELTEEDYDRVMQVNAKGVFLCSQEAARVMSQNGGGSIIHISSTTSVLAEPNTVEYGASKGAVASMTRHMALDLGGYNIRVNAIAPGTIRTQLTMNRLSDHAVMEKESGLTMLNRVGETDDIVGPAVFLASNESSFITGSHIFVDGGFSVK
ncbi:SDR family oxidoreductase [Alkalihalobacillus sp. MEB130]|uniref:SDR family NAD(P)-dependent oxidoreductase n=1 Tax=Alkalihalobacillus sp. MEB130 TaxID=2976704 RepID=UPI0028DFE727|nr:SDR family oxidoreductase [Alkalihalobacillus sp. MEB130]MDT8860685.1 SDR family oxidoreductase [Alkalihalobacillus sp. MEB130]